MLFYKTTCSFCKYNELKLGFSAENSLFTTACRTVEKINELCTVRGGRPTTSISSPNHILIIFSSEPHRNPRPFNIIFQYISQSNIISFQNLNINQFIIKSEIFFKGQCHPSMEVYLKFRFQSL